MKNVEIIPSILTQSEQEFSGQIAAIQRNVSMVQIDIADGDFVPNQTWADPDVIAEMLEIDVELHLMVRDPLAVLQKWEGIQQVKRVIIHAEAVKQNMEAIFTEVEQLYDWQRMVAINPKTQIAELEGVLGNVFGVMFLGVEPGFQGQEFDSSILKKIEELRSQETGHFISVDGGVNLDTIDDLVKAGVDAVCPGSAIFRNKKTPAQNVEIFKKEILKINN